MAFNIISFAFAILGIIATYYYAKKYSSKKSFVVFTTNTSEIIRSENAEKSEIKYSIKDNYNLGDIYKSSIFVGNIGDSDIHKSSIVKSLKVKLNDGANILKVEPFKSEKIDFQAYPEGNIITFEWDLIKAGEFIGCEVLINNSNDSSFRLESVDTRITDLGNVLLHNINSSHLYIKKDFKKKKRDQLASFSQIFFFVIMSPILIWGAYSTMNQSPRKMLKYKVVKKSNNLNVNVFAINDTTLVEGYINSFKKDTISITNFKESYEIKPYVESDSFGETMILTVFILFATVVLFFNIIPKHWEERSKMIVIDKFRMYYGID